MQARRKLSNIFNVSEEKTVNLEFYIRQKDLPKSKGKIKVFSDIQELKEFTGKPYIRNIKGSPSSRRKMILGEIIDLHKGKKLLEIIIIKVKT